VVFAVGDTAVDAKGHVTVETAGGGKVAAFQVAGTYQSANFDIGDNAGDVQVTFVAAPGAPSHAASTLAAYSPIQEYGENASELASWPRAYEQASLDVWLNDPRSSDGVLRSLGAQTLGSEAEFERPMTAEPFSGGSDWRGHLASAFGEALR
jgi:hypothetical protein